jgi:hypothetical protein
MSDPGRTTSLIPWSFVVARDPGENEVSYPVVLEPNVGAGVVDAGMRSEDGYELQTNVRPGENNVSYPVVLCG